MASGDIYQMTIISTLLGQTVNNVFHFEEQAAGEDPVDELKEEWDPGIIQAMCSLMSDQFDSTGWRIQKLFPEAGDSVEGGWSGSSQGAVSGDALPSFNAALINWRTGFASRRKRGRTFLAGLPEGNIAGNGYSTTFVTQVETFISAMIDNFGPSGTSNFKLGVLSLKSIEERGTYDPEDFTPITSGYLSPNVAVMRRRKPGYGV